MKKLELSITEVTKYRRSQGVHWVHMPPEKKFLGPYLQGKVVKCTPGRARVPIFLEN